MPASPPNKTNDPQAAQYAEALFDEIWKQRPDIDQVKWLTERADLTHVDVNGNTALMHVCSWGNQEVMQKMLVHGVHINQQNNHGHSAIHLAAHSGNEQTVNTMLAYGGNFALRNDSGDTPYVLAQGKYSPELMAKLKENFEQHDPGLVARRQISAYIDENGLRLVVPTPAPPRAQFKARTP